jgi:hypothetical protein
VVAEAFGVSFSVVSGGVACVIGALSLGAVLPGFRNQHIALGAVPDEAAAA